MGSVKVKSNRIGNVEDRDISIDGFNARETIEILGVLQGVSTPSISSLEEVKVIEKGIAPLVLDTDNEKTIERIPNGYVEIVNSFLCPKCNQGILIEIENGTAQIARDIENPQVLYKVDLSNRIEIDSTDIDVSELALELSGLIKTDSDIFEKVDFKSHDGSFETLFCTCSICEHVDTYEAFAIAAKSKELDSLCYACGGEVNSSINREVSTTENDEHIPLINKCEECELSYEL